MPPEWLPYVAPTAAVVACIVSAIALLTARSSLKTARKTYERAGPRVRAEFTLLGKTTNPDRPTLRLKVWNAGLAATMIETIRIGFKMGSDFTWDDLPLDLPGNDPALLSVFPFPLSGQSAAHWDFAIGFAFGAFQERALIDPSNTDKEDWVRVTLVLGSGVIVPAVMRSYFT